MENKLETLEKKKKELEAKQKLLRVEIIDVDNEIDEIDKEQGNANLNFLKENADVLLKYAEHSIYCNYEGLSDNYSYNSCADVNCCRCFLLRLKNQTPESDDYRYTIEIKTVLRIDK